MEVWKEIVVLKHKKYSNEHLPHTTVCIKTLNITIITGDKLCSWQSLFFFWKHILNLCLCDSIRFDWVLQTNLPTKSQKWSIIFITIIWATIMIISTYSLILSEVLSPHSNCKGYVSFKCSTVSRVTINKVLLKSISK